MDRYNIRIKLMDGNIVEASVVADSCDMAVRTVKESPEFRRFAGDSGIASIEPLSVDIAEPSVAGYTVTRDGDTCSCADIISGAVMAWKAGDFNGTQEVISAPECGDAMQAAAVMRKMAEWLREERPWLL